MKFDDEYSIMRSELYPPPPVCKEHFKTVILRNISNQDVFHETFETFVSIGNLSKTEDGNLEFKFLDSRYDNCGPLNTHLRLNCKDDDGKESTQTIAGLEIESGNITGLRCKGMGYLNSSNVQETFQLRKWSECFTSLGEPCDYDPYDSLPEIIGASLGFSLLLLASVGVVSGLLIYRKREVLVQTITTDLSPSHIVFNKSDNIRDEIDMAGTLQVRKREGLNFCAVTPYSNSSAEIIYDYMSTLISVSGRS